MPQPSQIRIQFNPDQHKAISHGEGPALVLSGAGSGKTGVITHRTARLIGSGVSPERILCLTFTRKAAHEMVERITALTSQDAVKKCFIGTFHAWGLIFLKRNASRIPFNHSGVSKSSNLFTLYDDNDRREALANVLKEMGIDFSGNVLRGYGEQISLAKNNLLGVGQVNEVDEGFREVYLHYQNFLTNRKACDFDDLLLTPYQILTENPSLLEKHQHRYDYVLVDEYQDTNHAQYSLLRLLTQVKPNIMVVGDDDQSIYSWRGARVENILDFEKDFPHTTTIRLEANYRSSEDIIACANSLISHNRQRKEKRLIPTHPSGDKIHVFEASNPLTEAQKVVEMIQTRIFKEDCSYGNFAILYRAKHQSKVLKESLVQSKIPYQAFGEIKFFDRKEIRDLIGFIKLLLNPHDDISFLRVINIPKRLRESALKTLLKKALSQQQSLYDFLKEMDGQPNRDWLKPNEWENLSVFLHFLDAYHPSNPSENSSWGKNTPNLFKEFLGRIEYRQGLDSMKEDEVVRERREKNLQQFFEIMKKYFDKKPRSNLDAFLTRITMEEDEEQEGSMVSLLTIHAAKGLEFPHVFIVGFEENLIPFSKEGCSTSEEEERRLAYVAITRAQKTCTLSFCKSRKNLGSEVHNPPSRFLAEITSSHMIKDYGRNPQKPPQPTETEREQLRSKALSRMKELLKE